MPAGVQLVVLLLALAGFWFIVVTPARKAQKRQAELQQAVEVGDEVIISAGIYGTVARIEDEKVGLEVAPGTVLTVARQAIVRRLDEHPDEPADAGDGTTPDVHKTEE